MNAGTERDGVVQIGDDDDPEMGCRIPAVASGPASITRLRHLLHRSAASERVLLRRQRRLRRRRVTMKTISAALHADGKMKRFFFLFFFFFFFVFLLESNADQVDHQRRGERELLNDRTETVHAVRSLRADVHGGAALGRRPHRCPQSHHLRSHRSCRYYFYHLLTICLVTLPPSTDYLLGYSTTIYQL